MPTPVRIPHCQSVPVVKAENARESFLQLGEPRLIAPGIATGFERSVRWSCSVSNPRNLLENLVRLRLR
jgi:hypothetical protein